jgi:hypothetical protein
VLVLLWYSGLANGIREGWAFLTVKNPLLIRLVYGFLGFSVDRCQDAPVFTAFPAVYYEMFL